MYYLGFDIGASAVKAALVENKKIIKSLIENSADNFEDWFGLLIKIFGELSADLEPSQIGGVGFGIAGTLDAKREKMLNSPNIKYLNEQPLKKLLAQKFAPHKILIEHDVHCFLLAEKEVGLAKEMQNVFYLTLGSGIGGAYMVNGKIAYGAHGSAGEAGHMIIKMNEEMGLEELAANKFIIKLLGFGSRDAIEKARLGEKKAKDIFAELGQNLGVGIANIVNIFDPEAVILSGGISEAKDLIMPGVKEAIEKFVISPSAKKTEILFSELGRFGGALGAALLAEKNE